MGRRIFLHIGTMKSATSYLGQLCEVNREHLADAGMYWPGKGLRYEAIRDFFGRPSGEPLETHAWRKLVREMRTFPGDVLLANEMLAALPVREVRQIVRALPASEVKVIVTARDLARVIPSHWQTTLKNGGVLSWREFCAAVCADEQETAEQRTRDWFWRRHDLTAVIGRWSRVVPVEDVTLVTVPPAGSPPETTAERFGSVVGVDLAGLPQPEWTNPSLGARSAELLRRMNLRTGRVTAGERVYGYRHAFVGALGATEASAEPRYCLSEPEQAWVRRRAVAMTEAVAASGVCVVGDLADLIPSAGLPEGCIDPGETTVDELLEAATLGLDNMVRDCAAVRFENRTLEQQVEMLRGERERLEQRVAQQARRIGALTAAASRPRSPRSVLSAVRRRVIAAVSRKRAR